MEAAGPPSSHRSPTASDSPHLTSPFVRLQPSDIKGQAEGQGIAHHVSLPGLGQGACLAAQMDSKQGALVFRIHVPSELYQTYTGNFLCDSLPLWTMACSIPSIYLFYRGRRYVNTVSCAAARCAICTPLWLNALSLVVRINTDTTKWIRFVGGPSSLHETDTRMTYILLSGAL